MSTASDRTILAARTGEQSSLRWWLGTGILMAAIVVAYWPALRGGFVWDDAAHVTRPDLRSWHGLYRIWFKLGATQQYYPLTHSTFWLEHRLWGDSTTGYHFVNLSLHLVAAVLFGLILRRLAIPGAFLAMAIFALHPVHVESVAWITELKNVLSAVFYLGAALAYLNFDERRSKLQYGLALGLFVLALLSKTVTATLPAALLVVFWWQRGRLSWRRDVLPLVPLLLLGLAAGRLTVWVERTYIGTLGIEYDFSFVQRCLIAGRAIWFYLSELVWPANLIFIYPRWNIRETAWWQYLYPLGVLVLLDGLWLLRRRSRAPLAAMLLFCGTLFPALGFFSQYSYRYSFVADHFQYLANLGLIALFSAGVAGLAARWPRHSSLMLFAAGFVIAGVLATLTWRQCRQYADVVTLYRETIARNPGCWLAKNNLGLILLEDGPSKEALVLLQEAVELNPKWAEAHNNLGNALQALGRYPEAVVHYREALQLKQNYAEAHNNLGGALQAAGDPEAAVREYHQALQIRPNYAEAHKDLSNALIMLGRSREAVMHCEEALRIKPQFAEAHNNLANALNSLGRPQEAVAHCQEALRLKPKYFEAHLNLGNALNAMGRHDEAIAQYEQALTIAPNQADVHNNLGNALIALGRIQAASDQYQQALQISPDYVAAHINLANALKRLGRPQEALRHFQEAVRLSPNDPQSNNSLAWFSATYPDEHFRDGERALLHARIAALGSGQNNPAILETLAAACAETGDFPEAVRWQEQALRLYFGQPKPEAQQRLKLYEAGRPFRESINPAMSR
ncbi:MAG: tetratricopeptide repeat protein [Planctomycetia bacterium]|nr:tetratricopeptide repeat protein [Planctomycetia bacterium]